MTDKDATKPIAGWVCYDSECAFCLGWVRRTERALGRRGFEFIPLQTPWVKARLNVTDVELMAQGRLILADSRILGGADTAVFLARNIWCLWPLWLVSKIPGAMPIIREVYRVIARNRYCIGGRCSLPKRNSSLDWLPIFLLPTATLLARDNLPNWVFMWLIVTAMFAGCKWLTWRRAKRPTTKATRTLGYLFAWPGMDAASFLNDQHYAKPRFGEWFLAAIRLVAGVILVWFAGHDIVTAHPMTNAWLGMFGITLILHFGSFHLVALAWQHAGVPAKPLMLSPTTATSLAAFWGVRWNTAFNKLVHDLAFRPVTRRVGTAWATMSVFAISGVIHELAISFPARGGYGFPFAYFLLQGVGVLIERSRFSQAIGLGHGVRGWLFMLMFTATPAYWLFHPTFVHNVILPMLRTIG